MAGADLSRLTPAQQLAIKTGDVSKLNLTEKAEVLSIFASTNSMDNSTNIKSASIFGNSSLTADQIRARQAIAEELGTTPEHLQEMVDVKGHEQLGKSIEGEKNEYYPALAQKIAISDLAGKAEIAVAKEFNDEQDPTAPANKDNAGVSVGKLLEQSDNPWVKSLDYGQRVALAMELQPEIVEHQKEGQLDKYGCGTKDGEKEASETGNADVATWKLTQLKSISQYKKIENTETPIVKGETAGSEPLPDPTPVPKKVETVHFSNGQTGPNVASTDLEPDSPLFSLAEKHNYTGGASDGTKEMNMQKILSDLSMASGGKNIVTYKQIADFIKKDEDYTKAMYDYKLPDAYKDKAIDIDKLKKLLGFAEAGDSGRGRGAFRMGDCTIPIE